MALPTSHASGDAGHVSDHNLIVTALTPLVASETIEVASVSGTRALSLSGSRVKSYILTGNVTFTAPTGMGTGGNGGVVDSFVARLTQDSTGGRSVTWWAGIRWPKATAPTMTPTALTTDVYSFLTLDGGATWEGFVSGQDIR